MKPFELKIHNLGDDLDGDPITSCTVEWVSETKAQAKAKTVLKTDRQRNAFSILKNVLADHSKDAPNSKDFPRGAKVVDQSAWRDACEDAGIFGGSQVKPAFSQTLSQIRDKGLIGTSSKMVCI